MPTHYATLGVPPGATDPEIRARYLELAADHHPDTNLGADPGTFSKIALAYHALQEDRNGYDHFLALTLHQCPLCYGMGQKWRQSGFNSGEYVQCSLCDGMGYQEKRR